MASAMSERDTQIYCYRGKVSAIVYANPDWRPAHGGQLRIWAPLGSAAAARHAGDDTSHGATLAPGPATPPAYGAVPGPHAGNYAALLERALGGASVRAGTDYANGTTRGGSSSVQELDADSNGHLPEEAAAPDDVQWTVLDGELVADIDPLAGRLVLMMSGAVDHAVLPSFASRVALTAWCQ